MILGGALNSNFRNVIDILDGRNDDYRRIFQVPPKVQPRVMPPLPTPVKIPAELYVPIPPIPVIPVKNDTANNFPRFSIVSDPKLLDQLSNEPQAWTVESGVYAFDTFFRDFGLKAAPFYNFWTPDEQTNDKQTKGSRELDEIPRYVRLFWNKAPDLNSKNVDNKVDVNEIDFTKKNKTPIKHSSQLADRGAVVKKGMTFKVPHLNDFATAKSADASGYVAAGAIRASVEVHDSVIGLGSSIVPERAEQISNIDESEFLSNGDIKGMSLAETQAMVDWWVDGATTAAEIEPSNKSNSELHDAVFKGNFSVKFPMSNGKMIVTGVNPSVSVLSMAMKTPQPATTSKDKLLDVVRKVVKSPAAIPDRESRRIRVNFFNPSLPGIISQQKINSMNRPEHIESMVALASLLPNLDMLAKSDAYDLNRNIQIPSFATPQEYDGVEYVGYIIEKYKKDNRGIFQLIEEIDIPHREYDQYVDCRVVYGGVYRYKIKAILRWTRPDSVGYHGYNSRQVNPGRRQADELLPNQSTYFSTGWSSLEYAFVVDVQPPPPPDELTVRPDSRRKHVTVTGKMPEDSQRDILKLLLYRKVQDSKGRDLTRFQRIGPEFGPKNFIYVDKDVQYNQVSGLRYVYAAVTVSRHDEVSTFSEQIGCRLNQDYATKGEYACDLVSMEGVPLGYYGAFASFPIRRIKSEVVLDTSNTKLVASGRNSLTEGMRNDTQYIVRAESLDTGEVKDVKVNIVHRNLSPFVMQSAAPINVSTSGPPGSVPGIMPK